MIFRRPLIRLNACYQALLDEAKADLAQLHFRHQCALADLTRELDEVRAELDELKTAVRRRVAAERELAELRTLRAAERDVDTRLH